MLHILLQSLHIKGPYYTMKGGQNMRKLNKINSGRFDTIEAYACVCSCTCSGACTGCACAISSAEYKETNSLSTKQKSDADTRGKSNGYRK